MAKKRGLNAVIEGNADDFAQWFMHAVDISREELASVGETVMGREEILMKLDGFTSYAVKGQIVVMRVPGGRALLSVEGDLVWVEFVPTAVWMKIKFWMNKSSMRDLGEKLREAREKIGDFDEIMCNAEERKG